MNDTVGEVFEQSVMDLFKLMGYYVEKDILCSGTQIDLLIEKFNGPFKDQYIVECKCYAQKLSIDKLKSFHSTLSGVKNKIPGIKGIVVTKNGLTKEAKAFSDSVGIQYATFEELEKRLFRVDSYAQMIYESFYNNALSRHFIPVDGVKKHLQIKRDYKTYLSDSLDTNKDFIDLIEYIPKDNIRESMTNVLDEWIINEDTPCLLILGDYGTGKTTLANYYAAIQAHKYIYVNNYNIRFPVIICLRDYPNGLTRQSLLSDISLKLNITNINMVNKLLTKGKLLLILDGFDEMGLQIDERMRKLLMGSVFDALSFNNIKMIVTGRPGYFPTSIELDEIVQNTKMTLNYDISNEIISVYNLSPFTNEQIDKYVESYSDIWGDDRVTQTKGIIHSFYDLEDLASRPFLLDLIVKTMPELMNLNDFTNITPATLYELYTNRWIDREEQKGYIRWLLSRNEKLNFMMFVATKMIENGRLFAHFTEISTWVKEEFNINNSSDIDYLSQDIRTCSYLVRDDIGNYRFVHKSFMEYFIALKIANNNSNNIDNIFLITIREKALNDRIIGFTFDIIGGNTNKMEELVEILFEENQCGRIYKILANVNKTTRKRIWDVINNSRRMTAFSNDINKINSNNKYYIGMSRYDENTLRNIKEGLKSIPKETYICSYCNCHSSYIDKLIAGPGVYICKLCVDEAVLILIAYYFDHNEVYRNSGTLMKILENKGRCSFCGKQADTTNIVLTDRSISIHICCDCIDLCIEILKEEKEIQD